MNLCASTVRSWLKPRTGNRIETTYTQVTSILSVCANWWNSNSDLCANVFERLCTCKGRGGVRHLHSGGDMFAPGHTSTVLRSTVHCPGTNSARIHLTSRPQAESAEEGCLKLRHRKHQKYARRKHSYELTDKEEGGCLRYSNSSWNSTLTKAWFRYRHEICHKIYITRFSMLKILHNKNE